MEKRLVKGYENSKDIKITNNTMDNLTKEQQEDIKLRTQEFIKEFDELVKRLQIDVGFKPEYVSLQGGIYATRLSMEYVDTKYAPIKTPFIENGEKFD